MFIIIQLVKSMFRSCSVLVLKILIVLVLVLVNEGVIIFVLVFVLVHEYITACNNEMAEFSSKSSQVITQLSCMKIIRKR